MQKKFKSAKEKREWEEHQKWLASHTKHIRQEKPKRESLNLNIGSTSRDMSSIVSAKSHGVVMAMDATAKKKDQRYTGTKIIGVATMHKSSLIPIFNQEQAIEVSTMRRN